MGEHAGIRVVRRSGSKLNFRPPVITNDSKFLLCASGECVRVFSTSTEECIHSLRGHTDQVTGVLINPFNHLQAYSSSTDGTVKLWDFMDDILIKVSDSFWPCMATYTKHAVFSLIFSFFPRPMSSNTRFIPCTHLHTTKESSSSFLLCKETRHLVGFTPF
ncbi:unnamed protein product [Tetraodon nigroviridis]|uniref:(spotted green pufferfish) hypothetical protein n=1 Tax=Tetraodon nigroviridis TaxID=99883 RepID=Q4RK36_TETNG|nr:unnamed protein product [Tetraodon nigroviridis]